DSNRHLFNEQLTALPVELLRGRASCVATSQRLPQDGSSGRVVRGHGPFRRQCARMRERPPTRTARRFAVQWCLTPFRCLTPSRCQTPVTTSENSPVDSSLT